MRRLASCQSEARRAAAVPHGGVAGGRTYDALILESARSAGATHLLTLNPRDFRELDNRIEIVEP